LIKASGRLVSLGDLKRPEVLISAPAGEPELRRGSTVRAARHGVGCSAAHTGGTASVLTHQADARPVVAGDGRRIAHPLL